MGNCKQCNCILSDDRNLCPNCQKKLTRVRHLKNLLKLIQKIDNGQIVRCKDCQYLNYGEHRLYCMLNPKREIHSNFYCNRGVLNGSIKRI